MLLSSYSYCLVRLNHGAEEGEGLTLLKNESCLFSHLFIPAYVLEKPLPQFHWNDK